MSGILVRLALGVALCGALTPAAAADEAQIARGQYLVHLGGCNDCHTAGHFLGHDDPARYLAGSDVGFFVPGLGVFVGPNLTPDKATGLGNWTRAEIVAAVTRGVIPGGRMLAPTMPWREYANLTPADADAIGAYLQSLPPVANRVPGPFAPAETPSVFVMNVLPGPVFAKLPKPE